MEIQSPIQFQLGDGDSGQKILLKTHSMEIAIEGKKLEPDYEYLLEQSLVWVRKNNTSFALETGKTILVSIQVNTI